MKHRIIALALAGTLLLSCAACKSAEKDAEASPAGTGQTAGPQADETLIALSDDGVRVNGLAASTDSDSAVWVGGEIIFYRDGTDETYGEGDEDEKHSAEEAAAHTVVTIARSGTYRVTGTLSRGQIFVDLGEDAKRDPQAVVTLILDNADVTCTVAPAVFFYRVYECDEQWVAYDEEETDSCTPSPDADTSAAGANVILAPGSENNITGSHVARIYKEGTTKKLHKYDGAFYSRMSMNISGQNGDDSGVLNIKADNEGLDSELHLTINGGTVNIESQDDGINTNEDGVSVTTINGGTLYIRAGRGDEGDGIDSNGYLTINGGTIRTMSNERTPDGGIDADCAITINGGVLYAFGTRNDAADLNSAQPYMELSFASTLAEGSVVEVRDETGSVLWSAAAPQRIQSITLTTPDLALDTVYHVYVNDILQCYSGNSFGMMGGFGGGLRPGSMEPPEGFDGEMPERPDGAQMGEPPEDFDPAQLPEDFDPAQLPEDFDPAQLPEDFDPAQLPEDFDPAQRGDRTHPDPRELPEGTEDRTPPNGFGGDRQTAGSSDGETDFVLTETVRSFSGVCDSAQSGKTAVTFRVEGQPEAGELTAITCSEETLAPDQIQITVTDDPSEDYAESCLLSDGMDAVNDLLPEDAGSYLLTVAVIRGSSTHTGAAQFRFTVTEAEADGE